MSSYLAIDGRAVLSFFNPVKTEQFMINYFDTVFAIHAHDQYSIKCMRSINFLLLFQSILQVYLFLCPFHWHRSVFFDIFDQSNHYPSLLKLNMSAIFLMLAYMFHMLYFCISSRTCFKLLSEYYLHDSRAFVKTPPSALKKLILTILNAYQVITVMTGIRCIC